MRNRTNKNKRTKQVTNVRVLDQDADLESAKVIRQISALHQSAGQIRVLVNSVFNLAGGTTETDTNYSFGSFVNSDEFTSFAAQYDEFRIIAMRFDCYNTATTVSNPVAASTFHINVVASATPTYTYTSVVDGEDAKIIPNDGSRCSFFWHARGVQDYAFQSTSTTATTCANSGGLRIAAPVSTTGGNIQTVVKFVADFRGRK